jgi:hypothetical protein
MRRLLLTFALAVSLSALYASPALARRHHHAGKGAPEGAQKAPIFGPNEFIVGCGTGGQPTAETFGFAVLNTPGDDTTLTGEVALKGAEPDQTFEVAAVQGVCESITPVGTITTNSKGNGNLHFTTARSPAATTFFVDLVREGAQAFATPAVELD